jgi:beta-glucanase (GH16 family)
VSRNRRHPNILALSFCVCLLGAMLIAGPAAEARSTKATGCVSTHPAKKAARGKHKKAKRKRTRPACVAPAPSTSGSPGSSTGGDLQPPPPPPPADACGARIKKSTGDYWRCTFTDGFNESSLDSGKWLAQRTDASGFTDGNTSCYVDDPDNVSVSAGTLKLTSREESSPFTCNDPYGDFSTRYTSGMVSTWGRYSQTYGRFEVRAKLSPVQVKGLQTAIWLWPSDATHYGSWPASGEIDIAEMFSAYPDRAIPYIHYNPAGIDPNVTNTNCTLSDLSAFHTYAVEWEPGRISVIYDGRTCLVDEYDPASPLTGSQPFDQPFIMALTQGLGVGGNAFDPETTPLPATTQFDYVRIWS